MRIITAPVGMAVSLAAFTAAVHIDAGEDAANLTALLGAAVEVIETATARPLLPRVMEFDLPEGEWGTWWFPVAPVIALEPGQSGTLVTPYGEPRFEPVAGARPVTLQATVGYADAADIPQALREAVILLAKEWYDARIGIEAGQAKGLSFGVERLIRQRRYKRPQVCA